MAYDLPPPTFLSPEQEPEQFALPVLPPPPPEPELPPPPAMQEDAGPLPLPPQLWSPMVQEPVQEQAPVTPAVAAGVPGPRPDAPTSTGNAPAPMDAAPTLQPPDLSTLSDPLDRARVQGMYIAAKAKQDEAEALKIYGAEAADMRKAAEAQQAAVAAERKQAEESMAQDRAAYREMLKSGPQTSGKQWAGLIAATLADVIGATIAGREPNTSALLDRFMQGRQEDFQRQAAAALDLVDEGDDKLAGIAERAREFEKQQALAKAAAAEELAQKLQETAASAGAGIEALNAQNAVEIVNRERDAAMAKAQALSEEQAFSRAERSLKMRKLGADTLKTEAEIAKLNRRGMGGAAAAQAGQPAEGLGTQDAGAVYGPSGTEPIAAFPPGDKNREKKGAEARETVSGLAGGLQQLAQIEALFEDYGERKLLDRLSITGSDEWKALEAQLALATPALAKISAGGLAATESDNQWARSLLQAPDAWTGGQGAAMTKLKVIRKAMEDQFRLKLQAKGLAPARIEALIKAYGARSKSKRDAAEEYAATAYDRARDRNAPAGKRLDAIKTVQASARKAADDSGNADDGLYNEIDALTEFGASLTRSPADAALREHVDTRLGKLEVMLEDRMERRKEREQAGKGYEFRAAPRGPLEQQSQKIIQEVTGRPPAAKEKSREEIYLERIQEIRGKGR